jgi:hypothetical protein
LPLAFILYFSIPFLIEQKLRFDIFRLVHHPIRMHQDFGSHLLFDLTQSFFQINKGSRKPWLENLISEKLIVDGIQRSAIKGFCV